MRDQTLITSFASLFCFVVDTREDANIHKAIACRYLSNNICTVVEEWTHRYFCLGYFFSSTHFDLVSLMARKVWWQCVLVFVHDLGSRDGKCIGLLSNSGLFFPLVSDTFSSINTTGSPVTRYHSSCLNSLVPGVKVPQPTFLIYTPLHHCFFEFLIIGHRNLLVNLHVVQDQ